MRIKHVLILIALLYTYSPFVWARLEFKEVHLFPNSGSRVPDYIFTGEEVFAGELQYEDCGRSSGDPLQYAVGCPEGYNFIIRDPEEVYGKIPLERTLLEGHFCPKIPDEEPTCELFIMLRNGEDIEGMSLDFTSEQKADLEKALLTKNVSLALRDLSLGSYDTANFVGLRSASTPPVTPKESSFPSLYFIWGLPALLLIGGGYLLYSNRSLRQK
jgi:hypothetical protein